MLAVAIALVSVIACSGPRKGSDTLNTATGDAREGERLYRRDCLGCHGDDGNRIPIAPLGAKDFLDSRGDVTLLAVVAEGKGTMPGFGTQRGGPLSDSEVRSVVAFISSKAGRSTTTLLAGQGALVYTRRCASCHGEDGNRIPISPLGAKGYLDTRTDSQLEEVIVQGRGNMPGLPTPKSGQPGNGEATAVISYLRYRVQALAARSVAAGRDLYVGNCLACHGSTGSRVDKVSLASADFLSSLGDGKVITAINEGTKSGPPFGANKGGAFQITDTAALLAYLKSWAGLNATSALGTVGSGGQGEALFVRNCAPCHGVSGDQVPGVQLRSKNFLDAKTKETVERTIRTGNRKGMPAWSQDAGGPLNDGQIKGLVEFLFTSSAAPAGTASAAGGAAAGGVVDGKPVADFFAAKCSVCHGADRKGGVGPALLPERLTKDDAFYEDTISKGRPGTPMPSWSAQGVKPDEIKTIVKFLKAPPGGAVAPAAGGGSNVQIEGKSVADFFQAKCAACHGADRKGVIGPALLPERLTKDNAFYEDTISKGRPGTPMPSWSAQGLTPEQIKAMVEFLKTPPAGAASPAAPSRGSGSVPVVGGSTAGLFGEALFKNTCALCHGQDGLQVKPCPIGSREWIFNMSPEGLITRISRGKPASGMPTWSDALGGPLSAAQIASVAAYLGEMAR